jgi:hypothetical protein
LHVRLAIAQQDRDIGDTFAAHRNMAEAARLERLTAERDGRE